MEPILDTRYWNERMVKALASGNLHHAVYKCPLEKWQRIEEKHRQILKSKIDHVDSILDAGCAWGRLLGLLPEHWVGPYLGIDLSPDFVKLAKEQHPAHDFVVADLRDLSSLPPMMADWAVLISIRPMVERNLGYEVWAQMEHELRRVCGRLLFLEYDEEDGGSVE